MASGCSRAAAFTATTLPSRGESIGTLRSSSPTSRAGSPWATRVPSSGSSSAAAPTSLWAKSSMPTDTRPSASSRAQVWPGWRYTPAGTWNHPAVGLGAVAPAARPGKAVRAAPAAACAAAPARTTASFGRAPWT